MRRGIALILFLTILTSFLSINVYAIDIYEPATDPVYKTCADHYFTSMGGRVPENIKESCVFVSLSMILSFYNCYWDDLFVLQQFENSSQISCDTNNTYPNGIPNILLENALIVKDDEGNVLLDEYVDLIEKNSNNYLHFKLISLAANNVTNDNNQKLINLTDSSYSINIFEGKNLLEHYLYNVIGLDIDDVEVHVEYANNTSISSSLPLYTRLKTLVKSGVPVLYCADKAGETIGHATVAYAINDNNEIKIHNGRNTTHTVLNYDYNLNPCILWIEIKEDYNHQCSSKYKWNPGEIPVCSCIAYKDMHPAHVHDKTFTNNTTDTTHAFTCSWCGDHSVFTESHGPFSYSIISNTYHLATCECGYQREEQHQLYSLNARYMACRKCPYTRDNSGGIEEGVMKTEEETETE